MAVKQESLNGFGIFSVFCMNCGSRLITNASGNGMWVTANRFGSCGRKCHDELQQKYTRSIMGVDEQDILEELKSPKEEEFVGTDINR